MADKIAGYLEVGTNGFGEIVINYRALMELAPDGFGHFVFSPAQARHLAELLMRKAVEADGEPRFRAEVPSK